MMSLLSGQSHSGDVVGLMGAIISDLIWPPFVGLTVCTGVAPHLDSMSAHTLRSPGICSITYLNSLNLMAYRMSLLAVCREIPGFLP